MGGMEWGDSVAELASLKFRAAWLRSRGKSVIEVVVVLNKHFSTIALQMPLLVHEATSLQHVRYVH